MFTPGGGRHWTREPGPSLPPRLEPPPTSLEGSIQPRGTRTPPSRAVVGKALSACPSRREGPARVRGYGTSKLGGVSAPTRAGGSQPHLWVRTAWHSRACGRRAFHRARQRAGVEGGVWPSSPPPPCLGAGLTSAWPPGVSVLLQCSHRRQNLCQSLPRELTFSAGREGSVSTAPPLPTLSPCSPPGPRQPRHLGPLHHPPGAVWPPPPSTPHYPGPAWTRQPGRASSSNLPLPGTCPPHMAPDPPGGPCRSQQSPTPGLRGVAPSLQTPGGEASPCGPPGDTAGRWQSIFGLHTLS